MGKKITIREAANEYSVAQGTVRRRIGDGTLTAVRVGPRLIRIDTDELERAFGTPVVSD